MSRARPLGRPGRLWLVVGACVLVALVGLGIANLPVAPNARPGYSTPDTAAGPLARRLESIVYSSPEVGWAVLPARPFWRLARSADGGQTWRDVTPLGAGTNGGLEVSVLGPQSAILAYRPYEYDRDSAFALSTDGGGDWTTGILPNGVSPGPQPMAAPSPKSYFAVLGNGELVFSADGGATWTVRELPAPPAGSCRATSVEFTSPATGWVSGICQGGAGLWETSDGGVSWQSEELPTPGDGSQITVALPQPGPAAGWFTEALSRGRGGSSVVLCDLATGASWSCRPAEQLPAGRILLDFPSPEQGLVLDAPEAAGTLCLAYETADGGGAWSFLTTPIPAAQATALDLVGGAVEVLAQGGKHTLLWHSANQGRTWSKARLRVSSGAPPRVNGQSL